MVVTQKEMNNLINAAIMSETNCFIQTTQLTESIGKHYMKTANKGTYSYKEVYEELLGTNLTMVELELKFDYQYFVPHFDSRGNVRIIKLKIVSSLQQLRM